MTRASGLLFVLVSTLGCSDGPLHATFTSRVVQREVCRSTDTTGEICEVDEQTSEFRVQLIEREDGNVWLYGIPRRGSPNRALLGTRDARGGFLFVDVLRSENTEAGCAIDDRREMTLTIDPAADIDRIGTDPCVALLGRETQTLTTSAGCDSINTPPVSSTLVTRRRWEPPEDCEP